MTTQANYYPGSLKEGDVLTNAKGNRTVKFVKNLGFCRRNSGHEFFMIEATDTDGIAYNDQMTRAQLLQRYPVKVDAVRHTLTLSDLTNEQLNAVEALLANYTFTVVSK